MKKHLNLYEQIANNKRRSGLIIAAFALFGILLALALTVLMELPPETGILICLVISGLILVQYAAASSMILAISEARPARREEYPFIYHTVEGLAIAAGIPAPKCYIIDSSAPNAFATGRTPKEGAVILTTGLIEKLNNEEIEGVIAHEIAHIQNYDIRLSTIAIAFIGVIALIGEIVKRAIWFRGTGRSRSRNNNRGGGGPLILLALVFIILAPIFAKMLQLALSRRREFLADTSGTWLTRNPQGLASALRKIGGSRETLEQASTTTAPLYIVNPLDKSSQSSSWFATHPPLKERIEILEKLAYK